MICLSAKLKSQEIFGQFWKAVIIDLVFTESVALRIRLPVFN